MSTIIVEVWKPTLRDLSHGLKDTPRIGEGPFAHVVDVYENNHEEAVSKLYRVVLFNDTKDTDAVRKEVRGNRDMWVQRWHERWQAVEMAKARGDRVDSREALELIRDVTLSDMELNTKYSIIKLICKEQICSQ